MNLASIAFKACTSLLLVGGTTACFAALKIGAQVSDFSTEAALAGQATKFSLSQTLKKGPVVLYFYPKAFTSGCTIEAHNFAEATEKFSALGATVVAGHRIVANLSALMYMLPLSLGIATMAAVGQAIGGRDRLRARAAIRAGLILAGASSTAIGLLLWIVAEALVAAYTDDPAVRSVALSLIAYVAIYQFFDALQTIAGHGLRAYRVTFVPMLVQTFCFWGVGLLGGAWLCYRAPTPLGVAGFWLAAVISLLLAAAMLLPLLRKVVQASESSL